ncbi:hypothetical protein E2C01_021458 [Portunus trituberculatus]|uniref:Uncharacterized protein n=1 Tax=Portunus trituberculatus TaxID=210409 RepID=A0A5B7E4B6_PORTR|nr:hypothetical protein [Portunus trituberculatus]
MEKKDDEEESRRLSGEIEEVYRLGKYEGKTCLLKIRIRSQAVAEEILAGSWRMGRKEVYKNVWLRRNLNEEESYGKQPKKKILNRTAGERTSYYWKVKDMRLRKWYTRRENKREISITVKRKSIKSRITQI